VIIGAARPRQAGPVVASAVALALRHGRFDELAMHPTVKPVRAPFNKDK
jgi:hypothetical protein